MRRARQRTINHQALPPNPTFRQLKLAVGDHSTDDRQGADIEKLAHAPVIFTDGAYSSVASAGGWAWIRAGDGVYASGSALGTTSQRMELTAAYQALRYYAGHEPRLVIVSDSAYLVNCFRSAWHQTWERKAWRTTTGAPVKNQDIWVPLIELALAGGTQVDWAHIKGHSGHHFNEMADRLAVQARLQAASDGPSSSDWD